MSQQYQVHIPKYIYVQSNYHERVVNVGLIWVKFSHDNDMKSIQTMSVYLMCLLLVWKVFFPPSFMQHSQILKTAAFADFLYLVLFLCLIHTGNSVKLSVLKACG